MLVHLKHAAFCINSSLHFFYSAFTSTFKFSLVKIHREDENIFIKILCRHYLFHKLSLNYAKIFQGSRNKQQRNGSKCTLKSICVDGFRSLFACSVLIQRFLYTVHSYETRSFVRSYRIRFSPGVSYRTEPPRRRRRFGRRQR